MSKSTLTDQELADIEECACAQLSLFETALILDLEKDKLLVAPGARAYLKGQTRGKFEAQKSLYSAALNGNTQALKQYVDLCQKNQPVVEE